MLLRRAGEPMETKVLVEVAGSKLMEQMRIYVKMNCPNKSSGLLF